ncbi:phage-related protein [Methanococcus voltae]|uniref:phage tail protein n=1 Tax=Methanococcus voltae TaxID=2188 RepID=UPI001AE67912|nr:hypothetical protein [Methanococcus voltae]MBP2143345.1 phage-related protein [Methanococcus voltae]
MMSIIRAIMSFFSSKKMKGAIESTGESLVKIGKKTGDSFEKAGQKIVSNKDKIKELGEKTAEVGSHMETIGKGVNSAENLIGGSNNSTQSQGSNQSSGQGSNSSNSSGIGGIFEAIGANMGDISNILIAITSVIDLCTILQPVLAGIFTTIAGVSIQAWLPPLLAIAAVVGTITIAISAFKKAWEENYGGIQEKVEKLKESFGGIAERISGVINRVMEYITSLYDQIINSTVVQDTIITVIDCLQTGADNFTELFDFICEKVDSMDFSWIDSLISQVSNFLANVLTGIPPLLQWLCENSKIWLEKIKEVINWLFKAWEEDFGGIRTTITNLAKSLAWFVTQAFKAFEWVFKGVTWLYNNWDTIWANMLKSIEPMVDNLINFAKFVINLWINVSSSIKDAWNGIVEFVESSLNNIVNMANSLIRCINAAALPGVEPIKLLEEVDFSAYQIELSGADELKNAIAEIEKLKTEFFKPAHEGEDKDKDKEKNNINLTINNPQIKSLSEMLEQVEEYTAALNSGDLL